MGIKAFFAKRLAAIAARKIERWAKDPIKTQQKVFAALIQGAKGTKFGADHNFSQIHTHQDFVAQVPIRDYEALRPYVCGSNGFGRLRCSLARKTIVLRQNKRDNFWG